MRNYRKDGTPFWNELAPSPVRNDAGTLTHFIGVQEDVSTRVQADDTLQISEQRARAQYEGNPIATYTWQRVREDWIFIDHNDAADRLTHHSLHEYIGETAASAFVPFLKCSAISDGLRRRADSDGAGDPICFCPPDSEARDLMNRFVPVGETLVTQYTEDITERKRAEEWRAHLVAVVEASADAIIGETLTGTVIAGTPGRSASTATPTAEMIGRTKLILFPPDRTDELAQYLTRVTRGEIITDYETKRVCKDGHIRDVSVNIAPIRGAQGVIVAAATVARDIGERKQYETRLIHDATYDALTGLPNRSLLLALAGEIDRVHQEPGYQFAVLYLDIDRFKYVNDSIGHTPRRPTAPGRGAAAPTGAPRNTTVARLGGDEFVVLMPDVAETEARNPCRGGVASGARFPIPWKGRISS